MCQALVLCGVNLVKGVCNRFVVVHGHTIRPEVEMRPNRIGIDTGAYRTGVLSALAIEGTASWLLDTRAAETPVISH